MSSDFEIQRLLKITSEEKYATTVAAFEVVDLLDQITEPKGFAERKPSIKAMQILSEDTVKFGFISDEKRDELYMELDDSEYDENMASYEQPTTAAAVAEKIFTPISNEDAAKEEREQDAKDAQMLLDENSKD